MVIITSPHERIGAITWGYLLFVGTSETLAPAGETIENQLLEKISEVLKIPVEAFQNFDEEQAVNLISCTFSDNAMFNNRIEVQNINPIDKIVQLHEEKIALYERMLKEKDEMMSRLEKLLEK